MVRDERFKLIRTFRREEDQPDQLFDIGSADLEGRNLCPCPTRLRPAARAAYTRLVAELERIDNGTLVTAE